MREGSGEHLECNFTGSSARPRRFNRLLREGSGEHLECKFTGVIGKAGAILGSRWNVNVQAIRKAGEIRMSAPEGLWGADGV